MNSDRLEVAKKWLEKLLANEKYYFLALKPSIIADKIAGVYAIFDTNTGEALYVGRTTNIRNRLYLNHLQGNSSTARLKKYIVEDEKIFPNIKNYEDAKIWINKNCYFQYV